MARDVRIFESKATVRVEISNEEFSRRIKN